MDSNLLPMSFFSSDEIHILSACVSENEKNIPYLFSILSEDERLKANNFMFDRDRKSFIISRGILRCLLGKYLKEDPRAIVILYGLWGKPCLGGFPLYFNLSHSKDFVLYTLTHSYEVGIDLEYIDNTLNIESMALSILNHYELDYWKNTKSEDKVCTFFRYWVCKEALLKASGKGWLEDQAATLRKTLDVFGKRSEENIHNKKMISPYPFEHIPGYASAFFIEGPFLLPSYYTWDSVNIYPYKE